MNWHSQIRSTQSTTGSKTICVFNPCGRTASASVPSFTAEGSDGFQTGVTVGVLWCVCCCKGCAKLRWPLKLQQDGQRGQSGASVCWCRM